MTGNSSYSSLIFRDFKRNKDPDFRVQNLLVPLFLPSFAEKFYAKFQKNKKPSQKILPPIIERVVIAYPASLLIWILCKNELVFMRVPTCWHYRVDYDADKK
jgi:hypothetical protein